MKLRVPKPEKVGTLEPTWVLTLEPGMDDIAIQAGDSLDKMYEDLKIYPFQRSGEDRLFLARFELPQYGEKFRYSEAGKEGSLGFVDFLAGFPVDCAEMLVVIGERSTSTPDQISVKAGEGKAAAPIPEDLFKWPDATKILLNLTALHSRNSNIFAQNLGGEPKPKIHWWFRTQLVEGEEGNKFPVPGEFLGLGVRMMPDKFWGHQKSSPFIYAGNWMDTVYYTGAKITEVIEPSGDAPYSTYKVKWRKNEITAKPSDFAEYKVDDRVTLLKDISTDKKTQLWKDNDMLENCDKTLWQIVPITFYSLDKEGE